MLFAKKRQRAVLHLVELPAAGYFLRGSSGEKEGPPYFSLLKLYKARRERMDERRFEDARPKQAMTSPYQRKPWSSALAHFTWRFAHPLAGRGNPGTDEIRGKDGIGHYTEGARHDRDLRFKLIRADQNLDYQILDTIFLEMESPLPRLF
ncbi:unnamed protein product [Vicia faba]|uniref:Uncharacterized protein n=1 Tax=Vicia faba TaxID=3906 RepID=A0AAV1AWG3_VICFA|nr:unnamed protein product [Vicia faba]